MAEEQPVRHLGTAYVDCSSCKSGDHEHHTPQSESADRKWTVNCRCPGDCAARLEIVRLELLYRTGDYCGK